MQTEDEEWKHLIYVPHIDVTWCILAKEHYTLPEMLKTT